MPVRVRRAGLAVAAAVALLAGGEIAARLAGVAEVPLFRLEPGAVYRVAPSQAGRFLRRTAWAFNADGLQGAAPTGDLSGGVLVVGDSLVFGGATVDGADKIDALLAPLVGRSARGAAAPGWSFANEAAFLRGHAAAFASAGTIAWIMNSGDFDGPAPWSSPVSYPVAPPWSALLFAVERRFLRDSNPPPPAELRLADADRAAWGGVLAAYPGRVVILKHTQRPELGRPTPALDAVLAELCRAAMRVEVVDAAADPRWNADLYRDDIHPTVAGNAVLAAILADAIRRPPPADEARCRPAPAPAQPRGAP